jgi:hypothetical protein
MKTKPAKGQSSALYSASANTMLKQKSNKVLPDALPAGTQGIAGSWYQVREGCGWVNPTRAQNLGCVNITH